MKRWLYNVRAVKLQRDGNMTEAVNWWPGPAPDAAANQNQLAPGPAVAPEVNQNDPAPVPAPLPEVGQNQPRLAPPAEPGAAPAITNLQIGRFIGQGRSIKYTGLSYAVMDEIPANGHPARVYPTDYNTLARNVYQKLQRRPPSWFVTALLSLGLVMAEVMLAFMLAFNTPTVGLGCWSGSFAIYAILSTLCWILALLFQKPGPIVTAMCYTFNTLAFGWLITVTMLVVSIQHTPFPVSLDCCTLSSHQKKKSKKKR